MDRNTADRIAEIEKNIEEINLTLFGGKRLSNLEPVIGLVSRVEALEKNNEDYEKIDYK